MNETIDTLIKIVPTLLFVFIVLISFLVGFCRGLRKSAIILSHKAITGIILFAIYLFLVETNAGDKFVLDAINLILGENGLQMSLGVSTNSIYLREVIVEFLIDQLGVNNGIKLILLDNGIYLQTLVNLIYHILLAIVFLVLYLVIVFILRITYWLFYSERKIKRRTKKLFMNGKIPETYKKRRLQGGLLGLFKGFVSATIALSILGSSLYTITGGTGEDSNLVEHDFENETVNTVYSIYRSVDNYGTTGIIKLFNSIKNKEEVPVYLLITDIVMHGSVSIEEEEGNTKYNLVVREELSVYTDALKECLNLMIKYSGDEVNSLLKGNLSMNEFTTSLLKQFENVDFQNEVSSIINGLLDSEYLFDLSFSLLDSLLSNIDQLSLGLSKPIQEMVKVMFKKGYLSEYIPSEKLMKENNVNIILPYVSTSYLIDKDDINLLLNMMVNLFSSSLDTKDFNSIKQVISNVKLLSIFRDQNKREKIEQVFSRVFFVLENTLLEDTVERKSSSLKNKKYSSHQEVLKDCDPEYYELLYGNNRIAWVDEAITLVDTVNDVLFLMEHNVNDKGSFDLFEVFNASNTYYSDNMIHYNNIVNAIIDSKLISRVLNTKLITKTIIDLLSSISPSFMLPENIEYAEVYDENGNFIRHGELYYLFNSIKLVLDTSKTNIYSLLTSSSMNLDTIKEIADQLNIKDDIGFSLSDYFIESLFMRSLISSILIDTSESNDLLYISKKALEKDENNDTINIIQKDELSQIISNLGNLIDELEPIVSGEGDLDSIINSTLINDLLHNKIIQGTIAHQIMEYTEDADTLVVPKHLKDVEDWVSNEDEDTELNNLFKIIKELDISLDLNEEKMLDKLKELSAQNRIGELFKSDILHYTISNVLYTGEFGTFEIIIPNSSSKILVNDSIDRLIRKEDLITLVNNIARLDLSTSTEVDIIVTNLIRDKETYLADNILSASLVSILVNDFSEDLNVPNELLNHGTKIKLLDYSPDNLWYSELPNLLNALDELFEVTSKGTNIDLEEDFNERIEGFISSYDQASDVVSGKNKLEVYYSSSIVVNTLTDTIDESLTSDLIVEEAKEKAKVNGIYAYEEILSLLDVISSYNITFDNIDSFNVNDATITPVLKNYITDYKYDIYLLRGFLTKQISDIFVTSGSGLHYHPLAFEDELLKRVELEALVEIIGGQTLQGFDSHNYQLTDFTSYIYDEFGQCASYILVSSISHEIMNVQDIIIPTSVVDEELIETNNFICIYPEELSKFISSTEFMGNISSLGQVSISNITFTKDVFESSIMNATIVEHLKINHGTLRKDAYVLTSRSVTDTNFINGKGVILLTEEEYIPFVKALDILHPETEKQLNFSLNLSTVLGLSDYQLDVILDSSILDSSINMLVSEQPLFESLITYLRIEQKEAEMYNLTTKISVRKLICDKTDLLSIVQHLR